VAVAGGLHFIAIHAGTRQACGLTTDSTAVCWGINSAGQLGIGRADDAVYRPGGRGRYPTPQRVIGGQHFASLSVGDNSCGITIGHQLLCWGDNSLGKLGAGSTARSASEPTRIADPTR
jgi:alpha-tubulin suppressor-like RCC1 family protein